jgi:hypothetical protein
MLAAAMLALVVPIAGLVGTPANDSQSSCEPMQHALKDLGQLKVGMSRRDAEKTLKLSGGLSSRTDTFYVYRGCAYVQVELDFEPDPNIDREFSPNDQISKISRPYLAYPAMD